MTSPDLKRSSFEAVANSMVGKELQQVSYYGIDYDLRKPWWYEEDFGLDSVEFGVDLVFHDASILSVAWGMEFSQWNLSINNFSLAKDRKAATVIDVTTISRWSERIHQKITSVTTYWSYWIQGAGHHLYYPQDLRLEFESGLSAYLSVSQPVPDHGLIPASDQISIIFDEKVAERFQHGPYAPYEGAS